MIDKLLKKTLAPQLQALVEKLDNNPDASSLGDVRDFVRKHERFLSRYERYVLHRAVARINRHYLLNDAMEIVLNRRAAVEISGGYYSKGLVDSLSGTNSTLLNSINRAFDRAYAEDYCPAPQEPEQARKTQIYKEYVKAESQRDHY